MHNRDRLDDKQDTTYDIQSVLRIIEDIRSERKGGQHKQEERLCDVIRSVFSYSHAVQSACLKTIVTVTSELLSDLQSGAGRRSPELAIDSGDGNRDEGTYR